MDEKFVYDLPEGWEEETVTLYGEVVPRYGRMRKRGYEHLGKDAPFCEDGALFDRKNPLRKIRPLNLEKQTVTIVSPLGKVKTSTRITVVDVLPGAGIYGDVGRP